MPSDVNLITLIEKFGSEDKCRAYLEKLRWPDGVQCPRCESQKISRIHDRDQFDCDECRYQFSVTAGTIMHDTKLPLWKWFAAAYLIVESKKGISAKQLERMIGVSYRTAWYLCHRIRKALETTDGLLSGIVEVDATYVGGATKGTGSGYKGNKRLVIGAVERDGDVRLKTVKGHESKSNIGKFARANIANDVTVYTDSGGGMTKAFEDRNRHERVNHATGEYVRGDVHTNSVEGVWSLFKRSVIGAYHQVSVKHLEAYLDEFEFRFNNRNNPYIFRDAMRLLVGEGNIEYKDLVA